MKTLALGLVAVATGVACSATRSGYNSAPYRVVRTDGDFELREYPTLTIVETQMHGSDESFMRLFRYIDGQNVATQKIAMTTPVYMTDGKMAFVMPEEMPADKVPQPSNQKVAVGSISAGKFAVMRFSGSRSAANETNALTALTGWVEREKLTVTGDPIFGYFDPPWTPPFARRNEVMLRLAP